MEQLLCRAGHADRRRSAPLPGCVVGAARGLPSAARASLLLTAVAATSGCNHEYLVDGDNLIAARQLVMRGVPKERLAIAAYRADLDDQTPTCLGYSGLAPSRRQPSQRVTLRAPDSRDERGMGLTFLVLGLTHLTSIGAEIIYELHQDERCRSMPSCFNEGSFFFYTIPIVVPAAAAFLIPGIVHSARGYGAPADVYSDAADVHCLGRDLDLPVSFPAMTPVAPRTRPEIEAGE